MLYICDCPFMENITQNETTPSLSSRLALDSSQIFSPTTHHTSPALMPLKDIRFDGIPAGRTILQKRFRPEILYLIVFLRPRTDCVHVYADVQQNIRLSANTTSANKNRNRSAP